MLVPATELKRNQVIHYAGVRTTIVSTPRAAGGAPDPKRPVVEIETSMGVFLIPAGDSVEVVSNSPLQMGG